MLLHVDTDQAPGGEDLAALIQRVISDNPGLTQKAIAEASGIPHATINAWITRRRGQGGRIDPDVLRALAAALPGVTVAEVFESSGRRVPADLNVEREQRLVKLFRNLSPEGQRAVIQTAEALSRAPRAS
jgi:transcriptional regulator with XRE-family HTH domain